MIGVTTFHPRAGETYARQMLESLVGKFDGRIIAYIEEHPSWTDTRIEWRDLYSIPGLNEFLAKLKDMHGTDGMGSGEYDYRYNASAFCRKVFAQDHVFDEDDTVIWFDSDCLIKEPFPEGFFEDVLRDVPFAFLGREGKAGAYTETGWLGFKTDHPDFPKFRAKYLPYFTSGEIFTQLVGWHDCIAFDHARHGIKGNNLTPEARGLNHVIGSSILAPYMDHKKGNRKYRE